MYWLILNRSRMPFYKNEIIDKQLTRNDDLRQRVRALLLGGELSVILVEINALMLSLSLGLSIRILCATIFKKKHIKKKLEEG